MPRKYSITFTNDESGEIVTVDGELSDEEVKVLEAFVKEAEEVWRYLNYSMILAIR